jgi:hypothetical protein
MDCYTTATEITAGLFDDCPPQPVPSKGMPRSSGAQYRPCVGRPLDVESYATGERSLYGPLRASWRGASGGPLMSALYCQTRGKVMTIRNVPDTSGQKCEGGCASWIAHWERSKGRSAAGCIVSGCWNSADVGAHIREVGESKVYIIPMCSEHNGPLYKDKPLRLDDTQRSSMVPAEALETCGPNKSLADLLK